MTQAEWFERFKRRLMQQADMPDDLAQKHVDALAFADASDGFEDDPEGAADMEMSYWSD